MKRFHHLIATDLRHYCAGDFSDQTLASFFTAYKLTKSEQRHVKQLAVNDHIEMEFIKAINKIRHDKN